jgi:5-hydroxyisourate hydrolase
VTGGAAGPPALFGPIQRISTHLLDTSSGSPAAGVPVGLFAIADGGDPIEVGGGITDADGRVSSLNTESLGSGNFRLVFDTAAYFTHVHHKLFYPRIVVEVFLDGGRSHYHVPVLASTYSYSTYLGS